MGSRRRPVFTIGIIAINVITFVILSVFGMTEDGGFMLQHGAMYVPYIIDQKEYYRLFTSIFLHFGFSHLMNNMIMLFFLGSVLEEELGRWKYLFLYVLTGLGGNLLSMLMDIKTGTYYVSAGASGAIFGVIGALIFIVIVNHGQLHNLSGRGIIFMAACSIYHGFSSTGVDNMAHIGGLLVGCMAASVLYRKPHRKSRTDMWS